MGDEVLSQSDVFGSVSMSHVSLPPSVAFSIPSGAPRSPVANGGLPIELETLNRQAAWEGKLVSLELKEEQLLQDQLKLMRQQITTTLKEVAMLRDEMTALGSRQANFEKDFVQALAVGESLKSVTDRLKALEDERSPSASLERSVHEMQRALAEFKDSQATTDSKQARELRSLKLALDRQTGDIVGIGCSSVAQASLRDRIEQFELSTEESLGAQARDLQALRDTLARVAATPGKLDGELGELKALFTQYAGMGDRLVLLEQLLRDHSFYAMLPGRVDALERRVGELAARPTSPPAAAQAPRPPQSPPVLRRTCSDFDCLKALHASTARRVAMVNEQKHIHYDPRTRRAAFLRELRMKKRHFGSDHVDEPIAEWTDEHDAQGMLVDVTILYQIFSAAAQEYGRDSMVSLTVVRSRNRHAKRASDLVRHSRSSHSHSPPPANLRSSGSSAMLDQAQAWELQLAQNRAHLIAESLLAHGIPEGCVQARVDVGTLDCYFVEFHFHFGAAGA